MKKKNIISIVLVVVSLGVAVLGYFILPEQAVIQFSIGASGNSTAPKLIAILLPDLLGIGGALTSLFSKGDIKSLRKNILVSVLGIGLGIFTIALNAFM